MKNTLKKPLWLYFTAFLCVLAFIAPAAAQDADASRLITSGIGKGQAAAQRTLSEIQTLQALETGQEAAIAAQQAALAAERAALNTTTGQINQIETDIGVLDADVQAVEADLSSIGPHAHATISTTCDNSGSIARKLHWDGTTWSCQIETDPQSGLHAKTAPPNCNPGTQKLIWTGAAWQCGIDVPGEGPAGNEGPAGPAGADGADGPTLWAVSGSNIYYNTGRVGVGTSAPQTPLHVGGDMRITSQLLVGGVVIPGMSSLCDASREGSLRYDSVNDALSICQNGAWINVLLGSASPCPLPWGGVILHTQSTTAYQTATVPFGNSCVSQVRSCNNGILSGTYAFGNCTVDAPANCNVAPWGVINNGASVTAYLASSVTCGSSCSSQVRTCNNGVLSGSYANASCSVGACANCTLDGATTAHGASRTYYLTSRACGATCASISQNRNCSNGVLDGSASYSKATCPAEDPCGCPLPWGGSIANGASTTAYLTSSVACGSTCTSQTRTCTSGTLSGTYNNQNCSVGACSSCPLPWGGSIAHNASVTAYASAAPACGAACSSQTRTCTNGTLSGTVANAACTSSCCLPWGGSINTGASTTAWLASSVACGSTCSSQTRTCTGTTLSGTYANASCSVGACANCTLDGVTVTHNTSRVFYLSSRACGQACTAIQLSRTCTNGTLSGSTSYNTANCPAEVCACTATSATSFAGSVFSGDFVAFSASAANSAATTTAACKTWCESVKAKTCLFGSAVCYAVWSGANTMTVNATNYPSRWSCTGGTSSTKPCTYDNTSVAHGGVRNPVCSLCATDATSKTCTDGNWTTMTGQIYGFSSCTACKVICTELYNQGLLSEEIYKADQLYGRTISSPAAMKVYSLWGVPTAQLMAKSPLITAIVRPLATAWAEHMAFEMGVTEDDNLLGRMLRMTFLPLHEALGAVFYPELNETPKADKPGLPSQIIPVSTLSGLKAE